MQPRVAGKLRITVKIMRSPAGLVSEAAASERTYNFGYAHPSGLKRRSAEGLPSRHQTTIELLASSASVGLGVTRRRDCWSAGIIGDTFFADFT